MDINEYILRAYKNNSASHDEKKDSKLKSKDKKINLQDDKVSVSNVKTDFKSSAHNIHKPAFEKISKSPFSKKESVDDKIKKQKIEKETEEQALLASRTGTYYQKKNVTSEDVKIAADVLKQNGLLKVPSTSKTDGTDSLYRRVAKFLVLIGIDEAAKILPHLTEEQTEKIIPEIATIKSISPEESEAILQEFNGLVLKSQEEGGLDTARNILTKAYGTYKANEILNKSTSKVLKPFDFLIEASAERINLLLSGENIGTKAVVLSQLEPKKAAQIINLLDVEEKKDIVLRLVKMKSVQPEVLENLHKALYQKLLTQNTENSSHLDGKLALAQILKRMDPLAEQKVIKSISEQDSTLGEDLRKLMFTEEDFVNSDNRFIQEQLKDMTDSEIAILIRNKSLEFREKVFSNLSKNRSLIVQDEEKLMGPVLKSDAERITNVFYATLRRAWEKGELRIEGRDDEEIYV